MLQIYDKNHNKIRGLINYKDLKIESELSSGEGTLSFLIPLKESKYIEHEGYIRTETQEYVIKEAPLKDKWNEVVADLNLEELKGNPIRNFDSTEQTIDKCIELAIAGSGYTVEIIDNITKRRTVRATDTNSLELLTDIKETYLVEIKFDTINKKVYVYEKIGSDKGAYFMDSLNLRKLEVTGDSYEFYTKMIAIGATNQETGETLKVEVTNNTYSSKVTAVIWKDERYTNEDSLRADAQYKLDEIAKPKKSYAASVYDLANMNEKYKNILDYKLGDTVTVIDKEKGIKLKLRIVKIIEYPLSPKNNQVELANAVFTFDQLVKSQKKYENTVDNITADNGTVSPDAIKSSVLSLINVNIQSLSAVSARIGELFTNQLKADVANISTGIVGKLLAQKAEIDDLIASNIKFDIAEGGSLSLKDLLTQFLSANSTETLHLTAGNVVIDEAVIKDLIASKIKVSDLMAGTINTNNFNIVSDDGGISIVGSTQQFKDKNGKVRLQLGKDAEGNFTFVLVGADGTTAILNENGITKDAIPDKVIVDSMVADDAGIQGKKIDIDSLITEVNNNNTKTIKGSKILVDSNNQTVDVTFKKLIDSKVNPNLIEYSPDIWTIGKLNFREDMIDENPKYLSNNQHIELKANTYTFSKYSDDFYATINLYDEHSIVSYDYSLPTDNKDSITFDSQDYKFCRVMIKKKDGTDFTSSTEIRNYKLKLEEGEVDTGFDDKSSIEALQTGLKVQQGQIEDLVKDTTIEKNGVTTKLKDAYSQVVQDVDGITTTVSSVETKVDNLQIGTRNLLLNTLNFDGNVWKASNATINPTKYNDFIVVNVEKNWGSYRQRCKYTIGKKYTFSFYAKASAEGVTLKFYNTNSTLSDTNAGGNNTTITDSCSTTWKRYNITFTALADIGLVRVEPTNIETVGGTLYVCGYMLEEGNMLSSYSQAPEDVKADINGIEQRVSSCEVRTTDEAFTVQVQKNQNRVYNVRYIRDYVSGSNKDTTNHWADIQVFNNYGSNVALSKTPTSDKTLVDPSYVTDGITDYSKCAYTASAGLQYVQIDLGTTYNNIDEIKIWHYYADGRIYNSTKTEISADGVTWITLFDSSVSGTYAESSFGHSVKVNNSSFNSSDVTINELGLHVRNGSIDIENNDGDKTLEADVNGNLRLSGTVEQRDYTTGYLSTALKHNGLGVYDWRNQDDLVGGLVSTETTGSGRGGVTFFADKGNILAIGYRTGTGTEEDFSNSSFDTVIQIDDTAQEDPGYVTSFYQSMAFHNNPHYYGNLNLIDYSDLRFYGSDKSILLGNIGLDGNNNMFIAGKKDFGSPHLGYLEYNNTSLTYKIDVGDNTKGTTVYGNFDVTGNKNRVVKTKDYGWLAQNAYETAECYFGDLMFVKTDKDGYCRINFDPKFLETVNTKCDYHVIHSCYGDDDDLFPISKCIEKTETYFVIKTNIPFTRVSVSVSCKQIDYENDRLIQKDIEDKNSSSSYKKLDKKMEDDKNENK